MKLLTHFGLPVLIIMVGAATAGAMVAGSRSAERSTPPQRAVSVEVLEAQAEHRSRVVYATGTVEAARQVVLGAEVSGRLVEVASDLRSGRRFDSGDVIARIDSRDYRLALTAEQTRVRQAELELALESGRGEVAEREWALLGDGLTGTAPSPGASPTCGGRAQRPFRRGRPGPRGAEPPAHRAARALQRDGHHREPGDGPDRRAGAQLASLVGTDRFFARVSVPVERLPAWRSRA